MRAAVQANQDDPHCAEVRTHLQESFNEKMFQHALFEDVSREVPPHRGHVVPFKTAAPEPQKCVPYRACGIRHAAFRKLVNRFIARGFLQQSEAVWDARE